MIKMARLTLSLFTVVAPFSTLSCNRSGGNSPASAGAVVLYTSVDEPYVRPLIDRFQKETGIAVTLLTDTEAAKSVGLAERIRAERDHPRCDVWWDNEVFLSARLAGEGILMPYDSPAAADIPAAYKNPGHLWAGSVLRVRVLVSSPGITGSLGPARSLTDLLRPEWKGKIAIARPTAGTTGGHVAALYAAWGERRADEFFRRLHDNGVTLVGGNSIVADSVGNGDFAAGLCDNDDAASTQGGGKKIDMNLPDQTDAGEGTLAMPCAVAMVNGCPHSQNAKKLIDFLLSSKVDAALIDAKFAWCSTRDTAKAGKLMKVDYQAVAEAMPQNIRRATMILEGR